MSINWNVPLKNGKDVFFTEESFNIFNNFVTFEERFLKRLEDHDASKDYGSLQSKSSEVKQESVTPLNIKRETVGKQTSHNKQPTDDRKQKLFTKEEDAQSSLKLAVHITKGRLPPPRKSSLCHEDQKLYLSLYSKYGGHSPADPTEEEITELNKLKVLQLVVKKEQDEYHTYALSLAKALEAEYRYMDTAARKYIETRLSARRQEVEMYPSQYNIVSSFPLKGTGQASQLTYIKPLLNLGSVPKMIIPTVTYDRRHQLSVDAAVVSQENPVGCYKNKEASWNHEACSLDQNAEILAVQHRGHIVISPGALMCLVDNHVPDYNRDWELPFSVKEYDVIEGERKVRHRIVYIDKPLPSSKVTERAMNTKFYKFLLHHIFCPHQSKDQNLDNISSGVDTASRKTEDKRPKGEEKGSLDKQAPDTQLGDIFDIGKSSMEEVETFGASSFESFAKKKKNEKTNSSHPGNSEPMDKVGKAITSRKVDQGSFDIFSDQTAEDIETFGVDISKSSKKTSRSKEKCKETEQNIEGNNVIEIPAATSTESTLSTSSDVSLTLTTQKPSTPVSTLSAPVTGTPSKTVSKVAESTSSLGANEESNSFSCDGLSSSGNKDTQCSIVSKETLDNVTLTQSSHATADTTDDSVTMETSTGRVVAMETSTGRVVAMERSTGEHVPMETSKESPVTMDTRVDTPVTMETGDCDIADHDERPVRSNTCQGLETLPYTLIPIDLPAATQNTTVNLVARDVNLNLNSDEKEHEIFTDAPGSPVAMDTPSSPNFSDCIASPSERTPKIIPISPEKMQPFCSPDFNSCVMIPLEVEGNSYENISLEDSQVTSQDPDSKKNIVSLSPPQTKRKVRRSTNTFLSDRDSDDEKLLIDVSSLDDSGCEEADTCSTRQRQVTKSKSKSNVTYGGKPSPSMEINSSFYDKSVREEGGRSTRVTRSRQSLDAIMAQMKSGNEKPLKKGDKASQNISSNSCEKKHATERCTRSKSETSITSADARPSEGSSGTISSDKTLSRFSKAKSSVPESDSDSCVSMDVDVKGQGSRVKRRSSRLSTGSSSSYSEVKDTESTLKIGSKGVTSEMSASDVKIQEIAALPIVRKRGRPRKTQPVPPSDSTADQQESRPKQEPSDTEATSIDQESINNPVPAKRKRGRPPKQKVEEAGRNAETTSNVGSKTETQSLDVCEDSKKNPSSQTGSKVKAQTVVSAQKTPTKKQQVNRVMPRLVATLIPKTEGTVSKNQTQVPKGSGPKTGTRRSNSRVSTFDSILKGMQNMLHTPDQNVKESQCHPSESGTSTFKQPDSRSNVAYHLWSLGGFQVVVRCGYHGTIRDNVQKLSKVHLCTKMEYQSSEGLEQTTPSEACRSWISGYIRPHCKLLRARIDPLKSELIALEEISLSQLIGSQKTFRPGDVFLMLQNIFHKLHLQPPGQYLLHHSAGDRNCNIKKSTDKKKRGSYDLHFQHFGFMASNTSNKESVPWLPIDPTIILPSHLTTGRIPATFEPADYTTWVPPKKSKGKKKKKQKQNRK
ncbi:little elongation complex subunit 2-like [Pecten maximus]|uniref:little elongation complex subunit 2-like n=1 Tax=Pecten maximus TaxID=6579 RepID=UPI001458EEF2|nr:little elongation complex subunit 2-like [Pecten maximus]